MARSVQPLQETSQPTSDAAAVARTASTTARAMDVQALLGGAFGPRTVAALQGAIGNSGLLGVLGLGRYDSLQGEEAARQDPRRPIFGSLSLEDVAGLDGDGDGHLSTSELDRALADRSLVRSSGSSTQRAAALNTLKTLRPVLEELSDDEWFDEDDGVTLADLEALAAQERTGTLREVVESKLVRYQRESVYPSAVRPNPAGESALDPLAVQQGEAGDCAFLSTVISAAARDPEAVRQMIEKAGDDAYVVTFPAGQRVTVAGPNAAELQRFATAGANGFWVTILEKAYATVRATEQGQGDVALPQEVLNAGESLQSPTAMMSGDGTSEVDSLAWTREETTHDKLSQAMREGRAVIAGIEAPLLPWSAGAPQGMASQHAYAVIGYDPEARTVTLRDPNAELEPADESGEAQDGETDGLFSLSLDAFDDLFDEVGYTGAPVR